MRAILTTEHWSTNGARSVTPLAEWLNHEFDSRGWSQREAARKTGVSFTALNSILKGQTQVPDLVNLDKIATALDVPLVFLIEKCGIEVRFRAPTDRDRYLADLVARQPAYRSAVKDLLTLTPEDFAAAAKYIEVLRELQRQAAAESHPDDETP